MTFEFAAAALAGGKDVRGWPITARIAQIDLAGQVWALRQTRQHFWPAVPDGGVYQDASIWLALELDSGWVLVPVDKLRPGQVATMHPFTDLPGALSGLPDSPLVRDILSLPNTIHPIFGVFVTTPANDPAQAPTAVAERSEVAFCVWPDSLAGPSLDIQVQEGDIVRPEPVDQPLKAVETLEALAGDVTPPVVDIDALAGQLDALDGFCRELHAKLTATAAAVERIDRQLAAAVKSWSTRAGV